MTDQLALQGPQWGYAVELYCKAGVAPSCLHLQDHLGVDVNVLLMTLFAATRKGMPLGRQDIEAMDAAVADWRDEVVVALRAVRRGLKEGPAPAPGAATEKLRSMVKDAELAAEQIELAVLAAWLERRTGQSAPEEVGVGAVLNEVAEFYAERRRRDAMLDGQTRDALLAIERAAT